MSWEREVKIHSTQEWLRSVLLQVGAKLVAPEVLQDDLVLDRPGGELFAAGELLRIRREGSVGWLTYKGPVLCESDVKSRYEIETPIEEPDRLIAVLKAVGFKVAVRYQKRRTRYQLDGVVTCLDETPMGWFLELEGDPSSIHCAATKLGFSEADFEARSYLELYRAGGGRGDMLLRRRDEV